MLHPTQILETPYEQEAYLLALELEKNGKQEAYRLLDGYAEVNRLSPCAKWEIEHVMWCILKCREWK